MKHPNTKKRLILMGIVLVISIGWYGLRHRPQELELLYKAPNLAPIHQDPVERTKYEEYEAILEKKHHHPNQKPKKSLVRFGLAKLFKPQAMATPTQKPPVTTASKPTNKQPAAKSPAPTYFFAYSGEAAKGELPIATDQLAHFFKARVYKEQKIRDKGAVVVKLQEKISLANKTLPVGTLLFGEAKFGKDRMYVTFTVAKWQEKHIPVHLQGYDQDLLLGWSAPGLVPSLSDQAEGRVVEEVLHHRGAGLLGDLGKGAIDTWREVKKKKEARLEDRKGVYVRLTDQKKSRKP